MSTVVVQPGGAAVGGESAGDEEQPPAPFGLPHLAASAECHIFRTGTDGQGQVLNIYTVVNWRRDAPPAAYSSMVRYEKSGVANPGALTQSDHTEHRLLTHRDAQDFARFCEEHASAELGEGLASAPPLPPRKRARAEQRQWDDGRAGVGADPGDAGSVAYGEDEDVAEEYDDPEAPVPVPFRGAAPHAPARHHAPPGFDAAQPPRGRRSPPPARPPRQRKQAAPVNKPVAWPSAWQFGVDPKDLLSHAQREQHGQQKGHRRGP